MRSTAMAERAGEELPEGAPSAGMPATPSPSSSSASGAAIPVAARTGCECGPRKRRRSARIDLDDRISRASRDMKQAQKQLASARAQARNERRRKQRLVKKAAALTVQDLQRIAELKRGGLWDPAGGLPPLELLEKEPGLSAARMRAEAGPRPSGGDAARPQTAEEKAPAALEVIAMQPAEDCGMTDPDEAADVGRT